MKLRYKIALLMFGFAVTFLGLTQAFVFFNARHMHLESTHAEMRQLANEIAERVDVLLKEKVKMVEAIVAAPILRAELARSNAEYAGLTSQAGAIKIEALNERWMQAAPSDPLIQGYTDNVLARHFQRLMTGIPGEFGELFLTNRQGALVAASGKLTTFAHAHKYWWKAAYDEGRGRVFIDDRGFDESVQGYVVGVVLPIIENGEVIGIFKANLNIEGGLSQMLWDAFEEEGRVVKLIRASGEVVLEKGQPALSTRIEPGAIEQLHRSQEHVVSVVDQGRRQLLAAFPVALTLNTGAFGFGGNGQSQDQSFGNRGEPWMILLGADQALMEAPFMEAIYRNLQIGFACAVLMVAIALLLGHGIARPISRLAKHAVQIGQGDFETTISINSHDEVGTLGKAFNDMVARLKETTTSHDKLAEEIERRIEVEEQLRIMSVTDELTGLYNRRGLFSLADERAKLAKRHNEDLYLLYADIDGLKVVNDTFGHDEGDNMIRDIAAALKHTFRESDIISRVGGDEFAVLIGESKDSNMADSAVSRLVAHLSEINAQPGRRYGLSVSTGVVKCDLQVPFSLGAYISRSDSIMYKNKKQKRA